MIKEFVTEVFYRTGSMSATNHEHRNAPDPRIGKMQYNGRCPQCGVRHFANGIGKEWCWNCDWVGG